MQVNHLLPENEAGYPGIPHGLGELTNPDGSSLHSLKPLMVDGECVSVQVGQQGLSPAGRISGCHWLGRTNALPLLSGNWGGA